MENIKVYDMTVDYMFEKNKQILQFYWPKLREVLFSNCALEDYSDISHVVAIWRIKK